MKICLMVVMVLMVMSPCVNAEQLAGKAALKTHLITDKLVYKPGDGAILAVNYENVGASEVVRNVAADPAWGGGGQILLNSVKLDNGSSYSRKIGYLPAKVRFNIPVGKNDKYASVPFSLTDEFGRPLPSGVYVLSIAQVPFLDAATQQTVYPTLSSVYIFVGA